MARYGDGGMPVKNPAMRGRVMHTKFEGPGVLFFASDLAGFVNGQILSVDGGK